MTNSVYSKVAEDWLIPIYWLSWHTWKTSWNVHRSISF